MKQRGKNWT